MSAIELMDQESIEHSPGRWLEMRRGLVTASEIGQVLGMAPKDWGGPYSLYTAKVHGDDSWRTDARQFRYGHAMEDFILGEVQRDHPELHVARGGLYVHSERRWQGATFDGLGFEQAWLTTCTCSSPDPIGPHSGTCPVAPPVVIQCKTSATHEHWGDAGSDQVPAYYRVQLLQEMDIAGAQRGLMPCLFEGGELRTYVIERDATAELQMADMRASAMEFLALMAAGTPPPVDWTPACAKALQQLVAGEIEEVSVIMPWSLARKLRAAKAAEARVERRVGLVTNQIRQRLGTGKWAVDPDGERLFTRSAYPTRRVDLEVLRAQYPGVAAACTVAGKPVDKLLYRPAKDAQ